MPYANVSVFSCSPDHLLIVYTIYYISGMTIYIVNMEDLLDIWNSHAPVWLELTGGTISPTVSRRTE